MRKEEKKKRFDSKEFTVGLESYNVNGKSIFYTHIRHSIRHVRKLLRRSILKVHKKVLRKTY